MLPRKKKLIFHSYQRKKMCKQVVSVCVCVSDGSPSSLPIDPRRVQADLAEVTVYLHPPEILTPTSVQITWTVRT